jgi:hypothetical protein
VTAQPEQIRVFRVFLRSGRALLVNATGQGAALDEAERQAVIHGWLGRDSVASKAELVK